MRSSLITIIAVILSFAALAQQPFEQYGYKVKVLTLSQGKYEEFFDQDTIVQIGSVMFNTVTNAITGFAVQDTVYSESNFEAQIISKFLSPDPLTEEYYSFSPYNFVLNNPIIYIDPDGRKVKPASKAAFNVLLNTLDPVSRKSVTLGEDGFVHINGSGEGANFTALKNLVDDDGTTEFILSENYEFVDSKGEIQTGTIGSIDNSSEVDVLFEAYGGTKSKEQLKAEGFSGANEDNGIFGITLLPGGGKDENGDGRGSANGNIIVVINPGLTDRNKAGTAAHEGFGHALFFILGKNPNHGESRETANQELEDQITKAVKEAFSNFDKSNN